MIAKKDMSLLKSFANPPIMVVHVGFLVLCAVGEEIPKVEEDPKTIYKKFQKIMCNPAKLLDTCLELNLESFAEERLERM